MMLKLFLLTLTTFIYLVLDAQKMPFIGLYLETSGNQFINDNTSNKNIESKQFAVGIKGHSAVRGSIQAEIQANYRMLDISKENLGGLKKLSIFEFYLGGRVYPWFPTFNVGKTAIRFTASGAGGFCGGSESSWGFGALFTAGFSISPIHSTSGVSVEFIYRTTSFDEEVTAPNSYVYPYTTETKNFLIKPSWALRIGFIIGPHSSD